MADMKNQGKPMTERAGETAQGAVDRVKDTAQHLAEKAGDYAGQAREKVGEWAGDAGTAARRAGEKVQRWAGDAYEATSETVSDFTHDVAAIVRKHPIPAILIGFGCGLLLGRAARMV